MAANKLVSNGQGLETARLGRDIGLSRPVYQEALTDGTVEAFLRGLIPQTLITRHVRVNRKQTPEQAINATGRVRGYIDEQVLAEMPTEGREDDNVVVFELDYDPTPDELDREYETHGLRPDPLALVQLMTDDPAFADDQLIAVQWRDSEGHACYAIFGRWLGGREVYVGRYDFGWDRGFRFAGVRK